MTEQQELTSRVYQGQFGDFTITPEDAKGVIVYRTGLMVAALCFGVGATLALLSADPATVRWLTPLYLCFYLALGVSLMTIHIYLAILHRVLQLFWVVGGAAAIWLTLTSAEAMAIAAYKDPIALFCLSFTFAALSGIYFKEAFCFNRLETKLLTPVVPVLILGHLLGFLSPYGEKILLATWAVLFMVFALRKTFQDIPADIGDKSVFAYLKQQRSAKQA